MFRNMGLQGLLVTAGLAAVLLLAITINVYAQDGGEECNGPTTVINSVVDAFYTIASHTMECGEPEVDTNGLPTPNDLLTLVGQCNGKPFAVRFCCGRAQGCTKTVEQINSPVDTPGGPASSLLNHRLRQINHSFAVCSTNPNQDTQGLGDMVITDVNIITDVTLDSTNSIYPNMAEPDQVVAQVKLKFIVCKQ
jgi:hypothetical protein